jgi:2-oxoglutarate ferredoxin oxidoreductase subunit alpha
MRGGPSTGMPTRPSQADIFQTRYGSHGDYPMIVLAPASAREIYDETIRAFDLAELCRTPVILLYDQVIAQSSETVALGGRTSVHATRKWASGPREAYKPYAADADLVPPMPRPGDGYRTHTTGLTHSETGFPSQDPETVTRNLGRLYAKLDRHRDLIESYEAVRCEDAEVVIVAIGIRLDVVISAIDGNDSAGAGGDLAPLRRLRRSAPAGRRRMRRCRWWKRTTAAPQAPEPRSSVRRRRRTRRSRRPHRRLRTAARTSLTDRRSS